MFITFEGIDGSGKSTQITLLQQRFQEQGEQVEVFREPGGTELSEQIRSLLLESTGPIDPVTELLLFSAARSQLIAEKVIPYLEQETVVILDRFYDSTTAYQGYGRGSADLEQVNLLNKLASHATSPDLTFYMRISLAEAHRRNAGKQRDRMESSGDDFFESVIEGFDTIAAREDRVITIDATLPREQVRELIWKQVKNYRKQ